MPARVQHNDAHGHDHQNQPKPRTAPAREGDQAEQTADAKAEHEQVGQKTEDQQRTGHGQEAGGFTPRPSAACYGSPWRR